MQPLAVRPHYVYVSRWPDTVRHLDTPDMRKDLPARGPLYTAFQERVFPREILRGVEIVDYDHGVLYEVVAERREGRPVLIRKTVAAYGADTLTDASQLPDDYLAVVAVDYWESEDASGPLAESERQVPSEFRTRSGRPSLERIAQVARDSQAAHDRARAGAYATRETLSALVPRHALARHFHVHVQTADVWLRQARQAGLLPPSKTGRTSKTNPKI